MFFECKDLCTAYGKNEALHGISFSIEKGEIVSIIGSNGAGKSTLLNTISGILPKMGGEIIFEDAILPLKAHKIVGSGIVQVPEGRKTFSALTVEENLIVGAYLRKNKGEIKRKREEIYELFPRLEERRNQYAATLSGGEQQMLAIGRGLMSNPKLLLLDEPSLGLAPIIVSNVFEIIKDIAAKGVTVLLVEQNAKKALEIANHAFVIENGKLTLQGTGKELLENPAVSAAYLGTSNH